MEMVFSVGSAPGLYNEDLRPAEIKIIEGVSTSRISINSNYPFL
jgi:hypothetical protein